MVSLAQPLLTEVTSQRPLKRGFGGDGPSRAGSIPKNWREKRGRHYVHVRSSDPHEGRSEQVAEEITARTVNADSE